MKRRTIVQIISVLFIILLLYAALSKLTEYSLFKEEVAASPFLAPIASFITPLIPAFEFAAVILLIAPRWRLKGLYLSTGLMIMFTIYLALLFFPSDEIPCSCGGVIGSLSKESHIILNLVFIALGALGIRLEKQIRKQINEEWAMVGKQPLNPISSI